MTHSAPSVRQESINNKKTVNVISAKKSLCPVIFFVKKALAPSFFTSKKIAQKMMLNDCSNVPLTKKVGTLWILNISYSTIHPTLRYNHNDYN